MTLELTYLFDPLCGWCYGASATLERLAATEGLTLTLQPTGLFSGPGARPMEAGFAAHAWSNDQRIARLTGQVFTEAYRRDVLNGAGRFDSGPADLALTAVQRSAPDRQFEALKAIQAARYVEGRDIINPQVLVEILDRLGLTEAAQALRAPGAALLAARDTRLATGRKLMRQHGADGVPALVVQGQLLGASALYGTSDHLIQRLTALRT